VVRVTAPRRTLLLIRHGETAWNAERRFTTRSDVPLSAVGLEQAAAAAAALAATAIDRIYSSPLRRARVTAETIAAHQPGRPAVIADDRLTEIDAGPFEGLTADQLRSGPMADDYARWHTNADPAFPEGAETFATALARAAAFLDEHAAETGTTLVVSHGSLTRLIVSSYFLGGPPPLHRHLWLDNCRLAVVEWRDGLPKITGFNVTAP
jgi:broad specificity phosphatase PhoE